MDVSRSAKIVVTGGSGFIGRALQRQLLSRGVAPDRVFAPSSVEANLLDQARALAMVRGADVVFHLAGSTGGIAFSRKYPASQFVACTQMDLNLFAACAESGVGKLVTISNLLAYPATAASPLRESEILNGEVAATHLGIGSAKRNLLALSKMFLSEKGLDSVVAVCANAYGPGDRFDPAHSHVIPALIHKCRTQSSLEVWGTGQEVRDFLYVDDVARGLILAAERLERGDYVNVGSGQGTSVGELVRTITDLTSFKGEVKFDVSKTGGDLVRIADVDKCSRVLGFKPLTDMRTGLAATVASYDAIASARTEKR